MIGKAINRWREEGRTVSITIYDGIIIGYAIGVDGEPQTVNGVIDADDLAVQIDNRLEDCILKDCRFISVVKR